MPIIQGHILEGSTIHTDGWASYDGLVTGGYTHHRVYHSHNEFARGKCHVNGIESFWSFAKRRLAKFNGLTDNKFYFHLKESEWRFNNRGADLDKILLKLVKKHKSKQSRPVNLYYITSLKADPAILLDKIRSHWKVEATHWILDVTFNEGKSAIAYDKAAENMPIIKRIALNMIKTYQASSTKKDSVKRIQKMCLINPETIKTILSNSKINLKLNL